MNNFFPNGTKVKISDGEIKGTTIGVCIRGTENMRIEYHVAWFVGGARHDAWLEEYEVEQYVETKKKAGLVNYETNPEKLISCE